MFITRLILAGLTAASLIFGVSTLLHGLRGEALFFFIGAVVLAFAGLTLSPYNSD